jgi:hypothetical protein
MTINRDNFESYLLDYLEGNLDPLLTADLMAFFAENPGFEQLQNEFDGEMTVKSAGAFENKNALKKDFSDVPVLHASNFEEFCIASVENILDEADEKRLIAYLAENPEKQADYDLYRKLKLRPDTAIVFTGKEALKKTVTLYRPMKRAIVYYAMGLAAAVLALLFLLTVNKQPKTMKHVAEVQRSKNRPAEVKVAVMQPAPVNKSHLINTQLAHNRVNPRPGVEDTLPQEKQPAALREDVNLAYAMPLPGTPILQEGTESEATELLAYLQKTSQVPALPGKPASPKPEASSDGLLNSLLAKVDFWETAEIAIQGFNYLTEAQLSIGKDTDAKGNTNGLQVDTESYGIRIKK